MPRGAIFNCKEHCSSPTTPSTRRDYAEDLAAAHRSDAPMYRETDQGLRELKIKNGERVVQQTSQKRIVSLVGGAMYEGTFNFPIPIAGISMADFDFRHTGAQLSTFFAGPILATDLSKQYGTKYRLAADLALSALPGENRIYNGNVENTARGDLGLGADHRSSRLLAGQQSSQLRPHSPIWPMTSFAGPATPPTNMSCRATAWRCCRAFSFGLPKRATSSPPTARGANASTGSIWMSCIAA